MSSLVSLVLVQYLYLWFQSILFSLVILNKELERESCSQGRNGRNKTGRHSATQLPRHCLRSFPSSSSTGPSHLLPVNPTSQLPLQYRPVYTRIPQQLLYHGCYPRTPAPLVLPESLHYRLSTVGLVSAATHLVSAPASASASSPSPVIESPSPGLCISSV